MFLGRGYRLLDIDHLLDIFCMLEIALIIGYIFVCRSKFKLIWNEQVVCYQMSNLMLQHNRPHQDKDFELS